VRKLSLYSQIPATGKPCCHQRIFRWAVNLLPFVAKSVFGNTFIADPASAVVSCRCIDLPDVFIVVAIGPVSDKPFIGKSTGRHHDGTAMMYEFLSLLASHPARIRSTLSTDNTRQSRSNHGGSQSCKCDISKHNFSLDRNSTKHTCVYCSELSIATLLGQYNW